MALTCSGEWCHLKVAALQMTHTMWATAMLYAAVSLVVWSNTPTLLKHLQPAVGCARCIRPMAWLSGHVDGAA